MVVVCLGNTEMYEEYHDVRQSVEESGGEVIQVETQDWPGSPPVRYSPSEEQIDLGQSIPLEDVTGVFTMDEVFEVLDSSHYGIGNKDEHTAYRQIQEWRAFFQSTFSIFERHGARVTRTPAAGYWDQFRPWMLELYNQSSLPVPETTFTNDPERVRAFTEIHEPVVVQFVNGGYPEVITSDDLTTERLEKLSAAPIKLQELVPGVDTRGYVIDGEFVGMVRYEYDDDAVSFKSPEVSLSDVGSTRFSPSAELREAIQKAGELTPSAFSAVDVRLTDDGEFTILESNASGRFTAHDRRGETDISSSLATYLMKAEIDG